MVSSCLNSASVMVAHLLKSSQMRATKRIYGTTPHETLDLRLYGPAQNPIASQTCTPLQPRNPAGSHYPCIPPTTVPDNPDRSRLGSLLPNRCRHVRVHESPNPSADRPTANTNRA